LSLLLTVLVQADLPLSALVADDECLVSDAVGSCELSALQFRASRGASGEENGGAVKASRRRRTEKASSDVVYKPTPVYDGPEQPAVCGSHTVKKGREGCCVNATYSFGDEGCCGSLVYRTDSLACCVHKDSTATIYDPMVQNCCDDEFRDNKAGGLCDLEEGETSCCQLQSGRRRRRQRHHHRHHHSSLLQSEKERKESKEQEKKDVEEQEE